MVQGHTLPCPVMDSLVLGQIPGCVPNSPSCPGWGNLTQVYTALPYKRGPGIREVGQ